MMTKGKYNNKYFVGSNCKSRRKVVIQEIYTFNPIITILKLIKGKNTLVIFDIDDVLIMPNEDNDFRHPYRAQLWQELQNKLLPDNDKIEILQSNIISTIKWQLIEPTILKMFNYLHDYNIPAIGLTAMGTGNFGIIEKKEDFRITGLKSVGLSFASLTPLEGQEVVTQLSNANMINKNRYTRTGLPMLKEGIIFTAGVDKGTILEYMLDKHGYYPETIIFVDDLFINIESIHKISLKLIVNFYGFHYKGMSFMPLPNINPKSEELRFKILERECRWFSCQELIDKQNLQSRDSSLIAHNFYN